MNNKLKNGKLPFIILSAITFVTMFIPNWFKSKVIENTFHSLVGVIVYLGKAVVLKVFASKDIVKALADKGGDYMAKFAGLNTQQTVKFTEKLADNETFAKIMASLSKAEIVVFVLLVFFVVFFIYWNVKAIKAMLRNDVFAVDYGKTASVSTIILGFGYLVVYAVSFVSTYVNNSAGFIKITRIFEKTLNLDGMGIYASSFTLSGILPVIVVAMGIAQYVIVKKVRLWTKDQPTVTAK